MLIRKLSPGGPQQGAARPTALVVEDDPQLQRALSRQLVRLEFRVLSASHYDAAVWHLAEQKPHVVCIDVGLPNKSGYELCEHIRGSLRLEELPILMMSEYGSPQDRANAEDAGASAFLRKPFSMRQFTRCIESLSAAARRGTPPESELGWRIASAPATRRAEQAGPRNDGKRLHAPASSVSARVAAEAR